MDGLLAGWRRGFEVFRRGAGCEERPEAWAGLGLRITPRRKPAPAGGRRGIEEGSSDAAAEGTVLAHEQDRASHRTANVTMPMIPAAPTRRGSGSFVRQSTRSAARKTMTVVTSTMTCVPMTAPAPTIAPAAAAVAPFVNPTTMGCFR